MNGRVLVLVGLLAGVCACSAGDPDADTEGAPLDRGTSGAESSEAPGQEQAAEDAAGRSDDSAPGTGAGQAGLDATADSSPVFVADSDDPVLVAGESAPPGCGDGTLDDDESCDDGNRNLGDGCAADCLSVEQGFECLIPGAACERRDVCGDAIVSGVETCDDGNALGGDGCSAVCFLERDYACSEPGAPCVSTVICGDGRVSGAESCDDGDAESEDGCSNVCELEPGYVCAEPGFACTALCGDGLVVLREQCDDGNLEPGDGCNASCNVEPGFACAPGQGCHPSVCGDGVVEGDEPCDDGSDPTLGDGCSPGCRLEPDCSAGECRSRCGDGLILAGDDEECDDGNDQSGDGCSAECRTEEGFSCSVSSDAEEGSLELPVVYRDFISRGYDEVTLTDGRVFRGHPDFDAAVGEVKGMVEIELAPPGDVQNVPHKPVYAEAVLGDLPDVVASRQSFNQWYADDPAVNLSFVDSLLLTPVAGAPGTFEFDDQTFFPLDGRGFSDPALAENGISTEYLTGLCDAPDEQHAFLFTSELRYWFEYRGGEQLIFRGDDDVWVFIKNRLVVDLGGIHGALGADVCGNSFHPDFPLECAGLGPDSVDQSGAPLDLVPGQVYEIAVFQAERRACQSSYRLTLSGFTRLRTRCESVCGDAVVAGDERCDDGEGNGAGYGFCSELCQPGPRCGDGIVNGPEQCDDGINADGYQLTQSSCAPGCVRPAFCGDGQIDAAYGEDCDLGAAASDAYGGCTAECRFGPRCGDGVKNGAEECDDGNRTNNDGCSLNCRTERRAIVR